MKKWTGNSERGFTMIELLVVAAIFGIVLTSLYSLFIVHQRAAYTSDETVEVQQNIRIAIDSITRDIRTAGLLLPPGNTPISQGTAGTINISSGCPQSVITRITPAAGTQLGTASPNTFTVDNDGSVSAFNNLDYVRIIRPTNKAEPGGTDIVYQVSGTPAGNSITLKTVTGYPNPTGITFDTGDVICKQNPNYTLTPVPPNPSTIQYYIGNAAPCPTGQQCLVRVDETGSINVIAQNMANNGLQLVYLFNRYPLPNESNAPAAADLSAIRAVRVTVTGQTAETVALSGNVPQAREMESLIQLRNP
jgi:type IV pilus assembly protein PilW